MVAQVAQRYEGKVAIIGMGSRDDLSRLEAFVDEHGLTSFPQVADESGELRGKLGVVGQPTWIFIDASGKAERVFGELGEKKLVEHLDKLLTS